MMEIKVFTDSISVEKRLLRLLNIVEEKINSTFESIDRDIECHFLPDKKYKLMWKMVKDRCRQENKYVHPALCFFSDRQDNSKCRIFLDYDILKFLNDDMIFYDFAHELLHCILRKENDKIVHPKTLDFLEKHFSIDPNEFMRKYRRLFEL